MSSSETLIINCGASRLTAATFSLNGSELMLDDFIVEELDYDYSIEDEWLGAVVQSLGEVVAQKKYQGPAIMIAPGYQLLTKTIKVPHVEAAKQSQIIAFEAQQNIPYPLDEVVWDKQVIADDGVETEVLLIAV
ncbi:MAG: pilus assembly protein PilM, partial [Verrucomicrobiota bacterium]